MPHPSLGAPRTAAPSVLYADLHLRFGERRIEGRVHWPVDPDADAGLAAIVLLDAVRRSRLAVELCRSAHAVVVGLSSTGGRGRAAMLGAGMATLGWAADHAEEIGAQPARLVVAGHRAGAAQAAWLAVTARDQGWPSLRRQLLVHPCFDAVFPFPPHPAGVAPATVVTERDSDPWGRAYAALLRRHGTDVRHVCFEDCRSTWM